MVEFGKVMFLFYWGSIWPKRVCGCYGASVLGFDFTSSLVRAMVGNMSCEGGLGLGFWRLCPICGVIPFRVTKSAHVPFRLSLFFLLQGSHSWLLPAGLHGRFLGLESSPPWLFSSSSPWPLLKGCFSSCWRVCVLLVAADKLVTAVSHSSSAATSIMALPINVPICSPPV